jgi:integrase
MARILHRRWGKEQSRHKSKTWSRANFTKAEAQAELDALLREQGQGGPRRDGSMTLAEFWDSVYHPVRAARWSLNSRRQVQYLWNKHIAPAFGGFPLQSITKADVDLHLLKMANAKLGKDLVGNVLMWLGSVLEEAVENDFIAKNPARKVLLPTCKPKPPIRSLTEDEIRLVWDKTTGEDYIFFRLLLLTGVRPGEALALERTDLTPEALVISKSALEGRAAETKNRKTRIIPLADALRAELEDLLRTNSHRLFFPTKTGILHRRYDYHMQQMLARAREATGIADLTFKMCRTTFETHFGGDLADGAAILGHHSPTVTLKFYKKAIPERQQLAVNELESRLRKVVPIRKGA